MKHELPKLQYSLNALAEVISEKTMEFHYGKHHQAYVNNLNNLIPGTKFENASLEQIVMEAEGGVFNNGAQVWNHTFYFEAFSPAPKHKPEGDLLKAIEASFGSFEEFLSKFSNAAATLFGSGWAWLVVDTDGKLNITQESNAGNPLRKGLKPLLTCDVWEHAYYLDYQNRRPDYIQAFWKIVDWSVVEKRFEKVR
ncbi:superoxide dismutase [Tenuifilum osseticum]|uniref:superoxide dismutase n=1 Tax=Tenuifilum osseticum TaxID=3374723 RepID=UPI0034E4C0CB